MFVLKDKNMTVISLANESDLIKFKRLLEHARHDIRIFNLGAVAHLQDDMRFLESLAEKL